MIGIFIPQQQTYTTKTFRTYESSFRKETALFFAFESNCSDSRHSDRRCLTTSAFKDSKTVMDIAVYKNAVTDSTESAEAFLQVYKVLMSPRCMNCHPAGDEPLQGDESKVHTMKVQRGKDGKGVYAAKCSNCHQPENTPGLHTPPGNPKWSLPPADMKMVFQGRTSHQLALQIM